MQNVWKRTKKSARKKLALWISVLWFKISGFLEI